MIEPIGPYRKTLNGQFIKEGEDFLFCGFLEPWYDPVTRRRYPGLEIFFDCEIETSEEAMLRLWNEKKFAIVIKEETDR